MATYLVDIVVDATLRIRAENKRQARRMARKLIENSDIFNIGASDNSEPVSAALNVRHGAAAAVAVEIGQDAAPERGAR